MRIIYFDQHAFWSPSHNAVTLHGGGEIHEVQVCEGFARRGHEVLAFAHGGRGQKENGVTYRESRDALPRLACDLLIVQTSSRIPAEFSARRTVTHQIHDPRPVPHRWDHFAGRDVTHVCVSAWLCELFGPGRMAGGGPTVAIHPPLDVDALRDRPRQESRFVTCASWNKGTDETLAAWSRLRGKLPGAELYVSSPYSEPEDAGARCARAGAHWIGRSPSHCIPELIASAGAGLFLVNVHPETFGVTVAFARLLDVPIFALCVREYGALREAAGANEHVTLDPAEFDRRVVAHWASGESAAKWYADRPWPPPDLSEESIMGKWLELLP